MTADVELLPSSVAAFVEALRGERGSLDAWLEVNNEREVAAHVEAYARANLARLQAEIEALRAEVEKIQALRKHHRARHKSYKRRHADAEARAERLAEALREAKETMLSQVKWEACGCGCPQGRKPTDAVSVTWLRAVQQVEVATARAEEWE